MNRTLKTILPLALSLSALLLSSCGDNSSDSHKEEDYELAVTLAPERRTYLVDTNFDSTGMEVRLRLKNSNSIGEKVEYTVLDGTHLDLEQTSVTIAYRSYRTSLEIKVKEKFHIACIGDSITFGAGVNGKTQMTWEHFLNELLGEEYQVINYGISGRTLQEKGDYPYKKDKFYQISLHCGAEIYLIMLGTNDAKPYNWDRERYRRELASFVEEYRALPQQPRVVLMTPPRCYDDPKIGKVAFDIERETIDREIVPILREEAEGKGLQGIQSHHDGHDLDVVMVLCVVDELPNGAYEAEDQHEEQRRERTNDRHCGGEYGVRLLPIIVGIAEECSLHAKGEEDHQECRVGIEVGDDAVASALCRDATCIERHKHVVQETSDNTAQAIDGCVFGQGFEICHGEFAVFITFTARKYTFYSTRARTF